jgi:hypothetical protein
MLISITLPMLPTLPMGICDFGVMLYICLIEDIYKSITLKSRPTIGNIGNVGKLYSRNILAGPIHTLALPSLVPHER